MEVVTRQEGSEGEVRETHDALREPKPPLPRTRPEQLSEALGPQCPRSRVPHLAVVMVQEAAHDDAWLRSSGETRRRGRRRS